MFSGISLVLGLRTRMEHPDVYVVFWALATPGCEGHAAEEPAAQQLDAKAQGLYGSGTPMSYTLALKCFLYGYFGS